MLAHWLPGKPAEGQAPQCPLLIFLETCILHSDIYICVRSWREAVSLSMRTAKPYLLVRISAMRSRSQMVSAPSSNWVVAHCAPVPVPVCPAVSIIIISN